MWVRTNTPTPTQIGKAVQQVLAETKFTARAKYFQTEINNYDAPTRSANLLEKLAISKRPILRT